jgi:GMP synthase-like glutamine amidotransferase
MIFLIINMYNNDAYFLRYKKWYKDALKGNKVIVKKWSDTEGIRKTLANNKVRGIIISGSDYFVNGLRNSSSDPVNGLRNGSSDLVNGLRNSSSDLVNGLRNSSSYYRSTIDERILRSKIPILAICYGFQYIVHRFGNSSFIKSGRSGYMKYASSFEITSPFDMPKSKYFFLHTDYIVKVPKAFKVIKKIKNKIMVAYNAKKNILGVQFHPERYKRSRGVFFKIWINKCIRK